MDTIINGVTWMFHWVVMNDTKMIHNLITTGHLGLTNIHGLPIGIGWYIFIAYVNGFFIGLGCIPASIVALIFGKKKTALLLFIVGLILIFVILALAGNAFAAENKQNGNKG